MATDNKGYIYHPHHPYELIIYNIGISSWVPGNPCTPPRSQQTVRPPSPRGHTTLRKSSQDCHRGVPRAESITRASTDTRQRGRARRVYAALQPRNRASKCLPPRLFCSLPPRPICSLPSQQRIEKYRPRTDLFNCTLQRRRMRRSACPRLHVAHRHVLVQ